MLIRLTKEVWAMAPGWGSKYLEKSTIATITRSNGKKFFGRFGKNYSFYEVRIQDGRKFFVRSVDLQGSFKPVAQKFQKRRR